MPAPPCEGGAKKLRAGALSMRPLWQPTAEAVAQSNMTRFARQAAAATGQAFPTYEALHHWSITDPGAFWSEIWRFADIQASRPAEVSVRNLDLFPGACWFPGRSSTSPRTCCASGTNRPLSSALSNRGGAGRSATPSCIGNP